MRRWGVPLLVVGVLLAASVVIALLPAKADDDECGASSLAIVAGADVPERLAEECHKDARREMIIAAFPGAAGLIGAVVTVALLRAPATEG